MILAGNFKDAILAGAGGCPGSAVSAKLWLIDIREVERLWTSFDRGDEG